MVIRFFTMWCRAALACRSPPRESRCRSVRPELTGMGAVPHNAAKEPEERSRSGFSPAVISIWAPMTGPMPLIASRLGLAAVARVSIRCSRSVISSPRARYLWASDRSACRVSALPWSRTWSGRVLASAAMSFASGRSRYRSRRRLGALTSSAPI